METLNVGVATIFKAPRAVFEASRCIECRDAPCTGACPAGVDIPGFIARIKMGDFLRANQLIREKCVFSGVCGMVCPVEKLCVKNCCIADSYGPVPINQLQRFVAMYEIEQGGPTLAPPKLNGKKVAVIGAGPAGLAVAVSLTKKGYKVTVFESNESPGGMMAHSIPHYRLPREILEAEIDNIRKLGVEIKTNTPVKNGELPNNGYDALVISTGTWSPVTTGLPGSTLEGVYQGIDFLRQISNAERESKDFFPTAGKKVAITGGGDVAMDSAISSVRLGAKRTHLLYRRSFEEMPAIHSEVSLAKERGVMFWICTNPTRIIGDDQGRVMAIECVETRLGKPDESGRKSPIPIPGTEFQLAVDVVIEAIGQKPHDDLIKRLEVETNPEGTVRVGENGETSRPGLFAAGDVVSGGATVIQAIAEGVRVSTGIDKYLGKTNSGT